MTRNIFLFTMVAFLGCSACNPENDNTPSIDTPSTSLNTIMPLGASRVQGARPNFESYRYALWKLLVDADWEFDYIGTMKDEGDYPPYAGLSFDLDHEGRGGWTSGQILNEIEGWLRQTGAPDIVLFSSPGGNDALGNLSFDQAISNINAIIDAIQTANPNVTILIEQMAPAQSREMTPTLTAYFNRMQEEVLAIASNQSTATSQVIAVDMYTGFNDTFLADDVHYNEAGAAFIAGRYYDVLVDVLKE